MGSSLQDRNPEGLAGFRMDTVLGKAGGHDASGHTAANN
jgi:hypothetical protein